MLIPCWPSHPPNSQVTQRDAEACTALLALVHLRNPSALVWGSASQARGPLAILTSSSGFFWSVWIFSCLRGRQAPKREENISAATLLSVYFLSAPAPSALSPASSAASGTASSAAALPGWLSEALQCKQRLFSHPSVMPLGVRDFFFPALPSFSFPSLSSALHPAQLPTCWLPALGAARRIAFRYFAQRNTME